MYIENDKNAISFYPQFFIVNLNRLGPMRDVKDLLDKNVR